MVVSKGELGRGDESSLLICFSRLQEYTADSGGDFRSKKEALPSA